MSDTRQLQDLTSIGPAMLRDFAQLGIRTVRDLARRNPEKMYEELCRATRHPQDICCLDVFRAAVAQARDPKLPRAQRNWWYWSRRRKAKESRGA